MARKAEKKMEEQSIIDEILNKMHDFGVKHLGKHPNWLYLNHEHFYRLKESDEFCKYGIFDETILGMQYQIRKDQKEIEVQ